MDGLDDMLKDFVVEALDLATNVEEHLLTLEKNPEDLNTLNAVFRSFHTIKGGAGFMNLPAMVSACHLTENLFDALRTGKAPVTPIAIEAALQASGFVADQLAELANGASPSSLASMPSDLEDILNQAIEGKVKTAPVSAKSSSAVKKVAAPEASMTGSASGKPDWIALYKSVVPKEAYDKFVGASDESDVEGSAAEDNDAPLDAQAPPARRSTDNPNRSAPATVKEDSIRVDAIKLDALLEVAGESVQAANQASALLEKLSQHKFEGETATLMSALAETLSRASRYSTELQRATLSTRMQPVGRLFQKFPRLVRELAKDLGKEVDLVIEGAETEVDRVVVDSLYDPLVHMLRNALDHGIESSVGRTSAGKPIKSLINLKAWQESGSVIIELSDDGKGMDPNELRRKAISKGLIPEGSAHSDQEAFQLVFLPGFSTKEVASSVSGRGVGMDVVKTAVQKHRGAIKIDSALGKGTRFTIRLPIELSIVPTMLVQTAGGAFALPMGLVERVIELPEKFQYVAGSPVMNDQGRTLPVRSLSGRLGYTPCRENVGVIISAPHPYILSVQVVDGTADMVIKPLTAIVVEAITGTARSAEGDLVQVLGLAYLMAGCVPIRH
jgi:two-component system chemotaxis sensor kinase CheA